MLGSVKVETSGHGAPEMALVTQRRHRLCIATVGMLARYYPPRASWIVQTVGTFPTPAALGFRTVVPFISKTAILPLVPRHGDYDWLILSQSRIGKSSGATRIWML